MFAELAVVPTISTMSTFMLYALFGAATRTLFGIYKAYRESAKGNIKISRRRVAVEILASMFFGSFSAMVLQGIGAFEYSQLIAAAVAGFLGADFINVITKKFGLTSSMKVVVTDEQMDMLGFNARQRKAIEYLNEHGSITNDIYQELTKTSHSSAKRDLGKLVEKNKIKKAGIGKATYYFV